MTTPESFSEKTSTSKNRRFFNTQFFMFQLKTGWPLFVVFLFVFVLAMIIPTVKYVSVVKEELSYSVYTFEDILENIREYLVGIGIVNIVISMFGGLLCGMTTLRYINNKVSVNFYHSLPLRREALFISSVLHSFVYYIAAFTAGIAVTFTIVTAQFGNFSLFIYPCIQTFLYGILFFLLLYSMTLFGASLTGTGFMRFVGSMYVIFLPIVIYMLFIATIDAGSQWNSIINIDYYLSENMISLCAPFRFAYMVDSNDAGNMQFVSFFNRNTAIVAVTAVVMFAFAFLLYIWRRSESASHPVIWKPASFVFKYASIFMGGTLFGLIFSAIFESRAWMIVGIIIGSIITFMLVNGILNKSARAIFKGIKGFVAFGAVMAAVTVVFYCDAFGIFAGIPSPSFVNRVEVSVGNVLEAEYTGDFAYRAAKLIGKVYENDKIKNVQSENRYEDYAYTPIKYEVNEVNNTESFDETEALFDYLYSDTSYENFSLEAVFHTKLGLPYAVRFFPDCETVKGLVEFIYKSGDEHLLSPNADNINYYNVESYIYDDYIIYGDDVGGIKLTNEELLELIGMLTDPNASKCDSPIIGKIGVNFRKDGDLYLNSNNYREYCITAADIEVIKRLYPGKAIESEDDIIKAFCDKYENLYSDVYNIYIVDIETGKRIEVKYDDNLKLEIIKSLYSFSEYNFPVLCRRDHSYRVFLQTSYSESDSEYLQEFSFREGSVPQGVIEMFNVD